MNLQDTIAFVTDNAGVSVDPVLTVEEIRRCVEGAGVVDSAGVPPVDPDWDPTYNENHATALALRLRARKATLASAGKSVITSWSADNASFTKQVRDLSSDLFDLADQWDEEAFGTQTFTGLSVYIRGSGGAPRSAIDLDSSDEFPR